MNYSEIKNLLGSIDSPIDRLEMVMDLGKMLLPIPENLSGTEIRGCASRVLIAHDGDNFYGTADSAIVRGILFILLEIHKAKKDLRDEFNSLDLRLGAGRLNGVESIISFLDNL